MNDLDEVANGPKKWSSGWILHLVREGVSDGISKAACRLVCSTIMPECRDVTEPINSVKGAKEVAQFKRTKGGFAIGRGSAT
jgi:hypothetical protein